MQKVQDSSTGVLSHISSFTSRAHLEEQRQFVSTHTTRHHPQRHACSHH